MNDCEYIKCLLCIHCISNMFYTHNITKANYLTKCHVCIMISFICKMYLLFPYIVMIRLCAKSRFVCRDDVTGGIKNDFVTKTDKQITRM